MKIIPDLDSKAGDCQELSRDDKTGNSLRILRLSQSIKVSVAHEFLSRASFFCFAWLWAKPPSRSLKNAGCF